MSEQRRLTARLAAGEGRQVHAAYCHKCGRAVASLHVLDRSRVLWTRGGRLGSANQHQRFLDALAWDARAGQPGLASLIDPDADWNADGEPLASGGAAYVDPPEGVDVHAVCPGCRQSRRVAVVGDEVIVGPWRAVQR